MADFDRTRMLEHNARQEKGYAAGDSEAIRNSTLLLKSRIHKELFLLAMIAETFGPSPGIRKLLEVGCGIGTMTGALRSLADEVIAIDLSPSGVETAKRRLADWPGITLEVADGTDPAACSAVKGKVFDFILLREFHPFTRDLYRDREEAWHVYRHIISEYAELLAPGGLIVVIHAECVDQAIRPEQLSLPADLELVSMRADPRLVAAFLFLTRNRLSWSVGLAKLIQPLVWRLTSRNVLYVLKRRPSA